MRICLPVQASCQRDMYARRLFFMQGTSLSRSVQDTTRENVSCFRSIGNYTVHLSSVHRAKNRRCQKDGP